MSSGPALILVDSGADLSTDYISPPIIAGQNYSIQIQAVWTASPVGTFVLQTSLDFQPGGNNPQGGPAAFAGTWDTYPGSSQSSSGANSCTWDLYAIGARWIRVMYTASSGSGTLSGLRAQVKL